MQLKDPNVLEAKLIEKFESNGANFYDFEIQYNVIDLFKRFINQQLYKILKPFLENTEVVDKAEELVERPTLNGMFEFEQNSNRVQLKLQFTSALFNGLSSIGVDAIDLDAYKAILRGRLILHESQLNSANLVKCFKNNQLEHIHIQTGFDLNVHSDVKFKTFDEIAYDEDWGPNDALGTLWFDCILTDDHYLSIGLFNHLADVKCQSLIVVNDEDIQVNNHIENFENYKEALVEVLTYGDFKWNISDDEMSQYIDELIKDFCDVLKNQINKQNLNEFINLAFTSDFINTYVL